MGVSTNGVPPGTPIAVYFMEHPVAVDQETPRYLVTGSVAMPAQHLAGSELGTAASPA